MVLVIFHPGSRFCIVYVVSTYYVSYEVLYTIYCGLLVENEEDILLPHTPDSCGLWFSQACLTRTCLLTATTQTFKKILTHVFISSKYSCKNHSFPNSAHSWGSICVLIFSNKSSLISKLSPNYFYPTGYQLLLKTFIIFWTCVPMNPGKSFFKRFYLFTFWEGKGGRKRRDTSVCGCLLHAPYWRPDPQPQACAVSGNQTRNPLVRSPVLNPLGHTSQGWILVNLNFYLNVHFRSS